MLLVYVLAGHTALHPGANNCHEAHDKFQPDQNAEKDETGPRLGTVPSEMNRGRNVGVG